MPIKTANCDGNECPGDQIQGWNYDVSRQPWCVESDTWWAQGSYEISIASYGSLARFKDIQRLHPVGNNTVIGASGDMSDFQYIQTLLDELIIDEFTAQDGNSLGPAEIHEYLSQVLYARRSQLNPLWNSLLVGGVRNGKRSVGFSSSRLPRVIDITA